MVPAPGSPPAGRRETCCRLILQKGEAQSIVGVPGWAPQAQRGVLGRPPDQEPSGWALELGEVYNWHRRNFSVFVEKVDVNGRIISRANTCSMWCAVSSGKSAWFHLTLMTTLIYSPIRRGSTCCVPGTVHTVVSQTEPALLQLSSVWGGGYYTIIKLTRKRDGKEKLLITIFAISFALSTSRDNSVFVCWTSPIWIPPTPTPPHSKENPFSVSWVPEQWWCQIQSMGKERLDFRCNNEQFVQEKKKKKNNSRWK